MELALPTEINAVGICSYNLNHKCATIKIAPTAALHERDQDLHETLVHELLHLYTGPIVHQKREAREFAVENLCNRLSEALVELAREAMRGQED